MAISKSLQAKIAAAAALTGISASTVAAPMPTAPVIAGSAADAAAQMKKTAPQSFEFRVDTTDKSLLIGKKPELGARIAPETQSSFNGTLGNIAQGASFIGQPLIGAKAAPKPPEPPMG